MSRCPRHYRAASSEWAKSFESDLVNKPKHKKTNDVETKTHFLFKKQIILKNNSKTTQQQVTIAGGLIPAFLQDGHAETPGLLQPEKAQGVELAAGLTACSLPCVGHTAVKCSWEQICQIKFHE